MRRVLASWLVLAALGSASLAHADVRVPDRPPEPVFAEEPPPEPAPANHGTLVHKPILAGLIAMLFLVMGGVAANDRHKKAASSRRA